MAFDRRLAQRRKRKGKSEGSREVVPDNTLNPMEQAEMRAKFQARLQRYRETQVEQG